MSQRVQITFKAAESVLQEHITMPNVAYNPQPKTQNPKQLQVLDLNLQFATAIAKAVESVLAIQQHIQFLRQMQRQVLKLGN